MLQIEQLAAVMKIVGLNHTKQEPSEHCRRLLHGQAATLLNCGEKHEGRVQHRKLQRNLRSAILLSISTIDLETSEALVWIDLSRFRSFTIWFHMLRSSCASAESSLRGPARGLLLAAILLLRNESSSNPSIALLYTNCNLTMLPITHRDQTGIHELRGREHRASRR